MRRTRRAIQLAAVLLVAAGIALLMIPPEGDVPRSESAAQGILVRRYDLAGDLAWEVSARRGSLEGRDARLEEVDVVFVRDGDTLLTAIAAEMVVTPTRAELLGGVTAGQEGRYELTTEALHWTSEAETLVAEKTTLTFDRGVIFADGFRYAPREERASLVGDVHGTLDLDEPAAFRGERAVWEGDEQLLIEEVEVRHGEWTYRADRAELSPDEESVAFSGGTTVALRSAELTADGVILDRSGLRAHGAVTVILDGEFFEKEDDA
ncbi:MAG: hypothetical protein JSW65_01705 [Candidatus Bipolaricaulota bacterium]|nr:MAG: hypothetical protein JSW65_01705 [Candidatus Bipolaricaulota bacterium]